MYRIHKAFSIAIIFTLASCCHAQWVLPGMPHANTTRLVTFDNGSYGDLNVFTASENVRFSQSPGVTWGEVRIVDSEGMTVATDGFVNYPDEVIDLGTLSPGYYEIWKSTLLSGQDMGRFIVTVDPSGVYSGDDTYIGVCGLGMVDEDRLADVALNAKMQKVISASGVQKVRSFFHVQVYNESDGTIYWDRYDRHFDFYDAIGVKSIAVLSGYLRQDMDYTGYKDFYIPDDMTNMFNFCREFSSRYSERLYGVELRNELGSVTGNMNRPGHEAASYLKIMMAGFNDAPSLLRSYASTMRIEFNEHPDNMGGAVDFTKNLLVDNKVVRYADFHNFHIYEIEGDRGVLEELSAFYQTTGLNYLPVVLTEAGLPGELNDSFIRNHDEDLYGRHMIRQYAEVLSAGVSEVYHWTLSQYDNNNGNRWGLIDYFEDGAGGEFIYPAARYSAFATLVRCFGKGQYIGTADYGDDVVAHVFDNGAGGSVNRTMVLWKKSPGVTNVSIVCSGATALVVNQFGKETPINVENGDITVSVGENPIFILSEGVNDAHPPLEQLFETQGDPGYAVGNRIMDLTDVSGAELKHERNFYHDAGSVVSGTLRIYNTLGWTVNDKTLQLVSEHDGWVPTFSGITPPTDTISFGSIPAYGFKDVDIQIACPDSNWIATNKNYENLIKVYYEGVAGAEDGFGSHLRIPLKLNVAERIEQTSASLVDLARVVNVNQPAGVSVSTAGGKITITATNITEPATLKLALANGVFRNLSRYDAVQIDAKLTQLSGGEVLIDSYLQETAVTLGEEWYYAPFITLDSGKRLSASDVNSERSIHFLLKNMGVSNRSLDDNAINLTNCSAFLIIEFSDDMTLEILDVAGYSYDSSPPTLKEDSFLQLQLLRQQINFIARQGSVYSVEYTTDLLASTWQLLVDSLVGSGEKITLDIPECDRGFFRLKDLTASSNDMTVLIDHVFDEGSDSLNGTLVDGGTLQTGSLAWITENNTEITANGDINVTDSQAAYIDLGTAISAGGEDDLYQLDIVVDNTTGTTLNQMIMGGFWDAVSPNVTLSHDGNRGTAWWFWRGTGAFQGNTGVNYTQGDVYTNLFSTTGGYETVTAVLDLTQYDGINEFGSVTLYWGDSENRILLGSAPLSGDESFKTVGFSTKFGTTTHAVTGTIQSLKLSKLSTVE
jgi:hypothetical protein